MADFMSLSFLQAADIFLLTAELKTKIALICLFLTFYYRNQLYQKPTFMFLFIPNCFFTLPQ